MNRLHAILFLLLIVISGCSSSPVIDDVFRWPPSGIPEADSALLEIERLVYFNEDYSHRAERKRLNHAKLCSISAANPNNVKLQIRLAYLNATKVAYRDNEAFKAALETAFQITDSAKYPFEYHKLLTIRQEIETDIVKKYNTSIENILYFSENDNYLELGYNLNHAGNVMGELRDTVLALEYYNRAANLFREIHFGHGERVALNNIAIHSSPEKRDSLLRLLLSNDSSFIYDQSSRIFVRHNLFITTDSLPILEETLQIYRSENIDRTYLPITLALMGNYHVLHGEYQKGIEILNNALDSAQKYAPDNTHHSLFIYNFLADAYYYTNDRDSCIEYLSKAREYQWRYNRELTQSGVYATDAATRIRMAEKNARLEKEKLAAIFIICLLLLSLVILLLVVRIKKRRSEKRYKDLLMAEKVERYSQSVQAQAKVMEEGEQLLATIGEKVDELKRLSKLSGDGAEQLMNVLRLHKSNEENRQGFLKLQQELDTKFAKRLKNDYPNLSGSLIKIASLIAIGLDIKQISSIMNIEPGSVHKSRYRIRCHMGLSRDQNLDEILKTYNRPL